MIDRELLKGSISILVLELLANKDMYGYEIIKELDTRSNNVFSFKEGTLYPVLHTLEKHGYIFSYWEDTNRARKRKYYHITDGGISELSRKQGQWKIFSEAMNNILKGGNSYAQNCV